MITLPRWFPELDVMARFQPLFFIDVCGMAKRYDSRWFIISALRVRLFCWRSTWRIDFGFNLYKREER